MDERTRDVIMSSFYTHRAEARKIPVLHVALVAMATREQYGQR